VKKPDLPRPTGSAYVPAPAIDRDDLLLHTKDVWPLPARGHTSRRWALLTVLGERDLPLAKVVEPHHDAIAILTDLGAPPRESDDVWAVWAADPPFALLTAAPAGDGWTLTLGAYTRRAGFWWGAIGIAAIWFGLAHLGAVRSEFDSLALVLDAVARRADEDPETHHAERDQERLGAWGPTDG
jgi:hypothetical protein